MPDHVIGLLGIGAILVLIVLRFPVGLALGGTALSGLFLLLGTTPTLGLVGALPYAFSARWELSAIPMFLLMGTISFYSGMTASLFQAARLWLGFLPGGLAVASNFACAGFAAASGSSVATAAAMGRIAIPEMLKQGYDRGLATGTVAAAGTLGSLIPPSILFVLYGVFAEVSITKLLIAGVFPGLLTATVYGAMIITRCKLNPNLAPRVDVEVDRAERYKALGAVWPLLVLILGIIGGLYGGIVTPTEAGAFGAFLAFVIGFLQGRMNLTVIWSSVLEAVTSTARIFFVAVGAVMLTKFLALTGMPVYLGQLIGDWALDPLLLVIGASLIYLLLGMFLDPLGILLITLPVLLPMFEALQLDLIWFGVLVVKYLEIGLLTPPVGFNVYVIKSVVGKSIELETIFKGVTWFLFCELIVVALLIAFPQISIYLPNTMD